jgi:hypothetical protein
MTLAGRRCQTPMRTEEEEQEASFRDGRGSAGAEAVAGIAQGGPG